jgi:hypothetical protein
MTKRLTLADCADAAGSINNPNVDPLGPTLPYVPPELCIGTMTIGQDECADEEQNYQESLAAEQLSISGAPLNVFKLLGVHEQGKLIDLVGNGQAIGTTDTAAAFDTLAGFWTSGETGAAVTTTPTYIGYDFGIKHTSYGLPANTPGAANAQHITSFRITQGPDAQTRALQVRIDRSNGGYALDPLKITTGNNTGNGSIGNFVPGVNSVPGTFMLFATSSTKFMVAWTNASTTEILGEATVGKQFDSLVGSFTIAAGTVPFAINDSFSLPIEMEWYRVDVVNLPNMGTPALIRIKQSSASRYWRIVPILFAGTLADKPWVVDKLELFDYQATTLDDIQDPLFMENRDRDYAKSSIQLRVQYTPFDGISDLTKFNFQIADIYSFTVSFAEMVRALGRPIIIGDVLDLPSEVQYDHNLKPVRKFLEVTDCTWAADGYTTAWKPIIFRFQAQQLIPGQEHRDILGTRDTQKYTIDDSDFFKGVGQIETASLTVTEANEAEAVEAVPEKGTNVTEYASGTNRFGQPGSYDGVGLYVEDGIPPDGQPYTTSVNSLPDVTGVQDGAFHRVEYPVHLNMAARLYKFSAVKNKWLYVETDRRSVNNAMKPSQLEIFNGKHQSATSKIRT